MQAAEARALLFQRKLNYEDYTDSLPGLPELDGQLGILELPADESVSLKKNIKDASGEDNEALGLASMVSKALVMRDTKERVFQDTDIPMVAGFGMSRLLPITKKISAVSKLSQDDIEAAKKNSIAIPGSDSATSSPAS